jgi:Raf kinase inhibitor-like YbhB/YbcL family protein
MSMTLVSSAFHHHGDIPAHYTCDGSNVSPPLAWSGAPANTQSFVLIVDDPDAPDPQAPETVWVHWVICNLPPDCHALAEAIAALPDGAFACGNDFQRTHYGGPCPPIGRHRYFFKLYALDILLPPLAHVGKQQVEQAMRGHILSEAELIGTYQRPR